MANRFYLIPLETIETMGKNYRGPKYLKWGKNPDGMDVVWAMMDFGHEPVALVVADVTSAQHTELVGNIDVISIPANLDNNVSSVALNTVRDALEGMNIPGNWVQTTNTYREVVRSVAQVFQFTQRLAGIGADRLFSNKTLSTTWADVPADMKQKLRDAADSMQMDYSFVTASTTIRQILLNFADQWGDKPIYIGGITL